MIPEKHILITGGAGYIGSMLTGELLRQGYAVTVIDTLLFGGDSLISFSNDPNFRFIKSDVWEPRAIRNAIKKDWPIPKAVIHLAAIVGFPACQAVGKQVAWRYNVESTHRVFEQCVDLGIEQFVYASTYSNYGVADDGKAVTESSPLNPQSLYAETKVASEEFLLKQSEETCSPIIFRFATLYGTSPRTRFDLIVNQFVYEAFTKRELLIYQRGYSRSFVHVYDVVQGIILGITSSKEKTRGQVYNLGTNQGNHTKDEVVTLILKRLPETTVRYKDLTFGGDMRDIKVSFDKIEKELGFIPKRTVDDGVREVLHALQTGLIHDPSHERYRNARFIVQ
ncbi:MAG: NAD(P)-dependent oxidoreductase [Chloroflexi bacterium]|jgi:nucleoside-diphosphate-sugar epimerase|nr:NAD(P)-dependent oxidoreductase [Chloroflexota bacterium]MBT3670066.1 NAD(P)-dependent oxidoreductase [Chloroflexota bacterium]MBT4002217.1 NAD(P)-dependent oxidoreductase [Chloroflexota bacterium]MBT4306732.1 NAD(P)-dependent oxidoreductase [Chloroflexota bacterium]MBT4532952.1 NAD(P)-dependent oxidoreductase [Chloroflexota bacterium]